MKNIICDENIQKYVKFRSGEILKIIDIQYTIDKSPHYPKALVIFENGSQHYYWNDGTTSVFENTPEDIMEILLLN